MPEHFIDPARLHDELLRLYREERQAVTLLDPVVDDRGLVRVVTTPRSAEVRA